MNWLRLACGVFAWWMVFALTAHALPGPSTHGTWGHWLGLLGVVLVYVALVAQDD